MTTLSLDLLGGMAHELRTPLGAIGGYAELLELGVHGPVTAAQVDGLRRIRNNQQLMVTLLNAFMAYSEAVTGTIELTPAAVDLDTVLVDAVGAFASRASERSVTLELAHDGGVGAALVTADRDALATLVHELLKDAVESAPSGGTVQVTVSSTGHRQQVRVETSGEPFAVSTEQAVFDPFSRSAKSNRPSAAPHALSLPHARVLARLMHGDVLAQADPARRLVTLNLPKP